MKNPPIEEFLLEEFEISQQITQQTQPEKEQTKEPGKALPNIDEIYQKAFNEGYEKGKNESALDYEQKLSSLKNQYEAKLLNSNAELKQSIQSIDTKFSEMKEAIKNIENDIVNIAIEISQKIIEKEIQNPETLKNLIKKTLSFAKSDKVKLKLNAKQAKLIEGEFENIEIIGDPALEMGTIIIEEDSNIIDASINTKLEELKRSLINES
ncbi:Flagellar assembly protein FliH [Desulfurella amilsii]|uniref:Flagellar assembly protein FliH n=1 Tax=Desulfurella amilsii TaxID=1562698 RepID=A0A1X4XVP9_9BACT|nr:FliH/SctL family protein [Desulfurella amilsii]OSS41623.1 Flagellar assembly protein FliH [Desulfurella amilsii]